MGTKMSMDKLWLFSFCLLEVCEYKMGEIPESL